MAMLLSYTERQPAALPYAEAGLKNADNDFSVHLMTRLCQTLRRDMKG